jgi:hypothetical protein
MVPAVVANNRFVAVVAGGSRSVVDNLAVAVANNRFVVATEDSTVEKMAVLPVAVGT